MQIERGVYKKEVFPGVFEYKAYTYDGECATDTRMPAKFATAATDEAFEDWLDALDPPRGTTVPSSFVLTPPAPGVRVA
jgi:hypothetical protein